MRLSISHPRRRRRRPADAAAPGERPVGRLHAERQDALQDRPHRALPDGRPVAVQARQPPERPAARVRDRRLEAGHGPQRLERRRRQRRSRSWAASAGTARTSSCPTASKRRVVGRALRVGQLPLEDLAQRQADRQEPRRLPAVRDPPAGRAAQARRRQPPGHPGRLAPQADRLPALGPVDRGQADGRLVELRRPAARGLPAQDQRRRLQHGRRAARPARARRARRRSPTA